MPYKMTTYTVFELLQTPEGRRQHAIAESHKLLPDTSDASLCVYRYVDEAPVLVAPIGETPPKKTNIKVAEVVWEVVDGNWRVKAEC